VQSLRAWGGLHGLVNNAAVYIPKTLEECTVEEFELHMRVNELGVFLGMKMAAPLMTESGGGAIVNVSSTAGLHGSPHSIAYCSTKWAVRGLSKAAAIGLAKQSIRVNSVHPGAIEVGMLGEVPLELRRQRIAKIPLGREGKGMEAVELIAFLLSKRCGYMTGSEIAIDGGVTA
jgi:3alpha(or 20beta)-hydroxysteroid dehydrogenase